jgi:hypothetical protein
MPTPSPGNKPPNAILPLAFAILSIFGLAGAMSGTGSNAKDAVVVLAVLTSIVLSTRYSLRTWRKLNEHDFKWAHSPRLVIAALAVGINGLACVMVAFPVILLLGVLITGKGIVG